MVYWGQGGWCRIVLQCGVGTGDENPKYTLCSVLTLCQIRIVLVGWLGIQCGGVVWCGVVSATMSVSPIANNAR